MCPQPVLHSTFVDKAVNKTCITLKWRKNAAEKVENKQQSVFYVQKSVGMFPGNSDFSNLAWTSPCCCHVNHHFER